MFSAPNKTIAIQNRTEKPPFTLMQIPSKTTKERYGRTGKSFCLLLHNTLVFYSYKTLGFPMSGPANTQVIWTQVYVKLSVETNLYLRPLSFKRPSIKVPNLLTQEPIPWSQQLPCVHVTVFSDRSIFSFNFPWIQTNDRYHYLITNVTGSRGCYQKETKMADRSEGESSDSFNSSSAAQAKILEALVAQNKV